MNRYYFDHNATTPVSPEAVSALGRVLGEVHGNASSVHQDGQRAREELEAARRQVADWLGGDAREIVLTSGGTEADNLAILGAVRAWRCEPKHVITTAVEHAAVLEACAQLEREGAVVTRVPVDSRGVVDPDDVRRALRPQTALVSVMHANNETGVVQPVGEIGRLAREAGVLFHIDGVQAAGKLLFELADLQADFYAVSGHKLQAPQGVGALWVRSGAALQPLQFGGRHERGLRAGTENVAGAAALGAAVAWLEAHGERECDRLRRLRDWFERELLDRVPGVVVNGAGAERLPNTSNLRFDGISASALVIALDLAGFAVSAGSACASGAVAPSHVLVAMGLSPQEARASLRVSFGRSNDEEQTAALAAAIEKAVSHLRRLSPSYARA